MRRTLALRLVVVPPMTLAKKLYVAISAHGYGHVAQTAPVLNALRRRHPGLQLVVESAVPLSHLQSRVEGPFVHLPVATDFGMVMHDALTVDVPASEARYEALHRERDEALVAMRRRMAVHAPDLVIANIPYLPIRAARELGVPAVALCSLNWADILGGVVRRSPAMAVVLDDLVAAYGQANAFLALEPGMPMTAFSNVRRIGPVAGSGVGRTSELRARIGIPQDTRMVLVSMGGIATDLQLHRWPAIPGIHWIMAGQAGTGREDMTDLEGLDGPYLDVLASCDATVTKLGYGAFVEAACAGVPVAYLSREQWPETPYLTEWLERHARAAEIDLETLFDRRLGDVLERLWRMPARPPVAPTGIDEAVAALEAVLYAGSHLNPD